MHLVQTGIQSFTARTEFTRFYGGSTLPSWADWNDKLFQDIHTVNNIFICFNKTLHIKILGSSFFRLLSVLHPPNKKSARSHSLKNSRKNSINYNIYSAGPPQRWPPNPKNVCVGWQGDKNSAKSPYINPRRVQQAITCPSAAVGALDTPPQTKKQVSSCSQSHFNYFSLTCMREQR